MANYATQLINQYTLWIEYLNDQERKQILNTFQIQEDNNLTGILSVINKITSSPGWSYFSLPNLSITERTFYTGLCQWLHMNLNILLGIDTQLEYFYYPRVVHDIGDVALDRLYLLIYLYETAEAARVDEGDARQVEYQVVPPVALELENDFPEKRYRVYIELPDRRDNVVALFFLYLYLQFPIFPLLV